MQIEVRLLARLFRMPLLRIDGFVVLRDDPDDSTPVVTLRTPGPATAPRSVSPTGSLPSAGRARPGRDLHEAEAILNALDG